MSNLEIYQNLGFKFILCKADKTPDTDESDIISIEKARTFQSTGRMIGAIIPAGIVILNINKHRDSENGVQSMIGIKEKYKIDYSINETLIVTTAGGGRHLFYTLKNKKEKFTPGIKAPGVELKTHSKKNGYVIAAGSPGYNVFSDELDEIAILFPELEKWLIDFEEKHKDDKIEKEIKKEDIAKKLPANHLKRVLKKIEPENFTDGGKWEKFIKSAIAISGNDEDVKQILFEWSIQSEKFKNDKKTAEKIKEIDEPGKITAGSFIYFLREENVSQYIINQIVKLDSISNTLIDAENSEVDLPFCDPDYNEISNAPAAQEFFHMQGNTSGASILEMAMSNKVLYSDGDKKPYYFDGNRWIEFNDFYGIIYTIIFRVIKIIYARSEADKEDNDRMFKCISSINSTKWKQMTWTELCHKEMIFRKNVEWDSPKIVESITTIDGVIDFKSGEMKERTGDYNEYRKSYFEYSTDEIMNASQPKTFIDFFNSLFPDKQTMVTAKYCTSMAISGNAGKRLFQLWQGIGSNGKSTLLETIRNVLGKDKSYKFPSEILLTGAKRENHKPELAKFQGKYFCYSSEADKGARLSQNTIKDMTGDETISAAAKYKNPVEFEATWQIIYAVNDLPAIYGDDYAFNDRLMVIPFKMFFYKDDDKKKMALRRGVNKNFLMKANNTKIFKKSLYAEKAGIIKWMIQNYNNLNNKMDGVIPESPECKRKKNSYIEDNDDMGVFISEICDIDETGDHGWFITLEEIAEEFRNFTGSHKKGTKSIIRDIAETHDMIERGVEIISTMNSAGAYEKKQSRVLKNIRLRDIDLESKIENTKIKDNDHGLYDDIPF